MLFRSCIDVLNQKLSENRDLLCIIAGYREDIDKCFFDQNKGLRRRFPFEYDISGYSSQELMQIYHLKMNRDKWELDMDTINNFKSSFSDTKLFKFFGGDIESLVVKTKIAYAQNHFYNTDRKIDNLTIKEAIEMFMVNRKNTDDELPDHVKMMYR